MSEPRAMSEADAQALVATAKSDARGGATIKIDEMIEALGREVHRLESSEAALLMSGLRKKPFEPTVRLIVVLESVHHLLNTLKPHADQVRAILLRGRGAR